MSYILHTIKFFPVLAPVCFQILLQEDETKITLKLVILFCLVCTYSNSATSQKLFFIITMFCLKIVSYYSFTGTGSISSGSARSGPRPESRLDSSIGSASLTTSPTSPVQVNGTQVRTKYQNIQDEKNR